MNKKPTSPTPARRHPAMIWLTDGACWFAVLCMLFLLININAVFTQGVDPLRLLLLYPLSLCFSAAGMVRRSKLSKSARYALHPLLSVGGFYLCGFLPYQIQSNARASTALIMMVLTLIVYGLIVGIAALVLRKKNAAVTENRTYENRFNGNKS